MSVTSDDRSEDSRILLGILDSVERDGGQSQRGRAAELGVALGLVNAYLKRCVKKGLVKVRQAPTRRYAYYLTPRGFAEKSRLTVEYLSYSFGFFRQARADCGTLLQAAMANGCRRIVLAGKSDLAEIAAICALEAGIEIVAVVDASQEPSRLIGIPVVSNFETIGTSYDAVLLTDLNNPEALCAELVERFGEGGVLVPKLLRLRFRQRISA